MRTLGLVLVAAACAPPLGSQSQSIENDDWLPSGTLHAGDPHPDRISPANQRRVYRFFAGAPADVTFTVASFDGPVRVAVLGPDQSVVGSAGYTTATQLAQLPLHLTASGGYQVVVAS